MILHTLIDYETLKVIWWLLLGILLIGFAVTDGFDLGVGMLHPFVAKTDDERRVVVNTVGPVWEGNQVWIILGAGAIFAAWPPVYATAFSGFYVAMFLALAGFILRPVSIVFRSKNKDPRWRNIWDWTFCASGFLPALIFGVAMGNVLQGVPFHFTRELIPIYEGSFFGLLNPFGLLAGLISVLMLIQHGSAWLVVKTDGGLGDRARDYGSKAGFLAAALFLFAGLLVAFGFVEGYVIQSGADPGALSNPLAKTVIRDSSAWMANYTAYPWTWIAPVVGVVGLALTARFLREGSEKLALCISGCAIAGVIATVGFSMFPFILPSSTNPNSSLTVWDSASSHLTLFIMLAAAVFFVPLILAYTAWVYRVLRGKVDIKSLLKSPESY